MKKNRQDKLIQLISDKVIDTQEELQSLLRSSGFEVTQATISRDIKELRIMKSTDISGNYRYIYPRPENGRGVPYQSVFAASVTEICSAMNDVVIKCHVGMAQGACAALDNMKLDEIVGTLAGDDTIFAVTKSEAAAKHVVLFLSELLK